MNNISKTILIISVIVFGVGFLSVNPVQAINDNDNEVRFTPKDIWVDFDGLPFDLKNFAPGMSAQKTIIITNNENFDIDVFLKTSRNTPFPSEGEADLADVLTIDGKSNYLSDLFDNNIILGSVNSGEFQEYNITLSFDGEKAGDEYQNKTINFDFVITAEEIGGGGPPIPPVFVSGGGGGGGGYYYYPPIITTTDTGEFTATPGEGGMTTLSNPDGSEIELIIPSGAVPENTDFTVKRADIDLITPPTSEKGFFMVDGLVYEIKAERNAETVTSFNKPFALTIIYPEDQIGNLDESSFQISWWNGAEWIVIENSEVNVGENTVTASINHLTLFALTGYETGFIEEETLPGEISEENVEGNISGTERGTEESETEELTAGEPVPELTGGLTERVTGEPELPPKSPAGLLTAATILTLGSGSNVVSIVISFLILGVFAFLYDKFLRKPEKKRF